MVHHQFAIIGGGTAGITVAARLLKKNKKFDIAIIDPAETHYYQPAWTLVAAGTYNFEKTGRPMKSVIPKGVKWIKDRVEALNPEENKLTTNSSGEISYDYLIVAPGVQMDMDGIEGLKENFNKNGVHSIYVDPKNTLKALKSFKGGNALFTQPAGAIKCGGAPQKIMYLSDELFRKTGVRNKTNIVFATPGTVIFGIKEFADTLTKVVDRKEITLRFFHKLVKIDGEKKEAHYQIMKENPSDPSIIYNPNEAIGERMISEREVVIPYDIMHLAPPQSAPEFIKRSKLSHQEGPSKGWMEVDQNTLQHVKYDNVFGLGDVAALPTAKTGAAVRKQAPVVVDNILKLMEGESLIKGYHGYSSCPLVTGYGKMVLAEFKYKNERDPDPIISKFVDTTKESYLMWLLKKYGLPFMYWNLMLKGKA